jgi:hypothetical protein
MTTAAEWRTANRKTVQLPSGKTCVIRKLIQRDYYPQQLANVGFDVGDESQLREYLRKNPMILFEREDLIICKAMVDPKVHMDAVAAEVDEESIHIREIDDADRAALLEAISEWSGMSPAKQAETDKFRDGELGAPRPDGQVLPQAPERTPGPAS